MDLNGTALSAKMHTAIELLFLDQLPDKEIAQACGISRATLANWKNRPEFQTALREFGRQYRQMAYARLESGSKKAVLSLLELLDSQNENVRLKAAVELLRLLKADQPPPPPVVGGNTKVEIQQFLAQIAAPNTASAK